MSTLGDRIAALRTRYAMSLDALSNRTKISVVALRSYEKNKSTPTLRTLFSLSKALRTTLNDLCEGITLPDDGRAVATRGKK